MQSKKVSQMTPEEKSQYFSEISKQRVHFINNGFIGDSDRAKKLQALSVAKRKANAEAKSIES